MICHECARGSLDTPGLGQCRFCLVSLCKAHLVESFRPGDVPQYACDHHAERPFETGHPVNVRRALRVVRFAQGV